ncbi:hypothetical protein MSTHC_0788 [Methanosarcina thermophila CHTI-55]|uniref:Uncharacterized protein n=1 Tax=Methanosarcina thermophila CHTI-55 TaxID=1434121 RepID=A0A0E3KR05_METTE|nr:hypothetical protein MSTHC_0788 [Methanosarcina thermophila CHTI-55]
MNRINNEKNKSEGSNKKRKGKNYFFLRSAFFLPNNSLKTAITTITAAQNIIENGFIGILNKLILFFVIHEPHETCT